MLQNSCFTRLLSVGQIGNVLPCFFKHYLITSQVHGIFPRLFKNEAYHSWILKSTPGLQPGMQVAILSPLDSAARLPACLVLREKRMSRSGFEP